MSSRTRQSAYPCLGVHIDVLNEACVGRKEDENFVFFLLNHLNDDDTFEAWHHPYRDSYYQSD